MCKNYELMSVSEKQKHLNNLIDSDSNYVGKLKINIDYLLNYICDECYREIMVSYLNLLPLLENNVPLEEADYIIYMHMYSRCDDMSEFVINQLKKIAEKRKEGAEIIVIGKAANAEKYLNDIPNITFWGDHFTEKLGKKFGYDIKEQYLVYDDNADWLAIWPVDGCLNKCKFCRRSYMDIKFESLSLDFLKKELDFIKAHSPEKMKHISLRAENLTEYGIDLYGKPMLHKLLELINSYDEVETFYFPIGLAIGEITPEILDSLCKCKKISRISLNLEADNDRLLKLIGKNHTCQKAIEVYQKLRRFHPDAIFSSTIMIGLPDEHISDMFDLAKLIEATGVNKVWCNYYIPSPKHPLSTLPQTSISCRQYHLKLFISYLKTCKLPNNFFMECWEIPKKPKSRKTIKAYSTLSKVNNYLSEMGWLSRHYIMQILYTNNTISIKNFNE